jgi:hypothetical protein
VLQVEDPGAAGAGRSHQDPDWLPGDPSARHASAARVPAAARARERAGPGARRLGLATGGRSPPHRRPAVAAGRAGLGSRNRRALPAAERARPGAADDAAHGAADRAAVGSPVRWQPLRRSARARRRSDRWHGFHLGPAVPDFGPALPDLGSSGRARCWRSRCGPRGRRLRTQRRQRCRSVAAGLV